MIIYANWKNITFMSWEYYDKITYDVINIIIWTNIDRNWVLEIDISNKRRDGYHRNATVDSPKGTLKGGESVPDIQKQEIESIKHPPWILLLLIEFV